MKVTSGDSVGDVSWRPLGLGVMEEGEELGQKKAEEVHTYRVIIAEAEAKAECLVEVKWVGIENTNVHLPFFEVIGGDEADAWWERLVDFTELL